MKNNLLLDQYQSLFSNPYLAAAAAASAYNINPVLISQVLAAANFQASASSPTPPPPPPPITTQSQQQQQLREQFSPPNSCKRAKLDANVHKSNDYMSTIYTTPSPSSSSTSSSSTSDITNNNPYHLLQQHLKQHAQQAQHPFKVVH